MAQDFQNIHGPGMHPHVFSQVPYARHPPAALGPVDHAVTQDIIIALQAGCVITPARRFPYAASVFLVPKLETESCLIVDYSKPCPITRNEIASIQALGAH